MDGQEMEGVIEGHTVCLSPPLYFSPVRAPWSESERSKAVPDFLLMITYAPGPCAIIVMLGVGVGEVGTRGVPYIVLLSGE